MSRRYEQFVAELEALCVKHDVQLSGGHDGMELWPLESQPPIYGGIRDMTEWQIGVATIVTTEKT